MIQLNTRFFNRRLVLAVMVNWDRISELREEVGEDDFAEVVTLFCEEVEEVLAILDSAPAGDMPKHLHFLKGSALNIGFEAVSTRCHSEEVRFQKDPSTVPDVSAIRADYSASKAELEGLL